MNLCLLLKRLLLSCVILFAGIILWFSWNMYWYTKEQEQQASFLASVSQKDTYTVQKMLSEHPHYISIRDIEGHTPLHLALKAKDYAMTQLIFSYKPDINAQIEGDHWEYVTGHDSSDEGYLNTPLHEAVIWGDVFVVQELLHQRARPNVQNIQGWTPLHLSILYQHPQITNLLLGNGANTNMPGLFEQRPLHLAVKQRNALLIKLLLKHQADPSLKDNTGTTALQLAQKQKLSDPITQQMIKLLS